jgi:hypothetical protein
MDDDIISGRIDSLIETLLPNGAGPLTDHRLRWALEQVAQVAYTEGRNRTLLGLKSASALAEELGVNRQTVYVHRRELERERNEPVGLRVPDLYLFSAEEVELLRERIQGAPGRPRKGE